MTFASVWLYGSWARGDSETTSDVDVLTIDFSPSFAAQRAQSRGLPTERICVSVYTSAEIQHLLSIGSIFLHHVRDEATLLGSSVGAARLREALVDLPRYRLAERDLHNFKMSLGDIRLASEEGDDLEAEYSMLGAICRHISVLGCYLTGSPVYGRSSIRTLGSRMSLSSFDTSALWRAHTYHLLASRRWGLNTAVHRREVTKATAVASAVTERLFAYVD